MDSSNLWSFREQIRTIDNMVKSYNKGILSQVLEGCAHAAEKMLRFSRLHWNVKNLKLRLFRLVNKVNNVVQVYYNWNVAPFLGVPQLPTLWIIRQNICSIVLCKLVTLLMSATVAAPPLKHPHMLPLIMFLLFFLSFFSSFFSAFCEKYFLYVFNDS